MTISKHSKPLILATSILFSLCCSRGFPKSSTKNRTVKYTYSAEEVTAPREILARYRSISPQIAPSDFRWFVPSKDPNAYLLAFPKIKLQSPYFLIAASWDGDTGHALGTSGFTKVYATFFNVDRPSPAPPVHASVSPKDPDFYKYMVSPSPERPYPDFPPESEDLLKFIEGDHSPESYLQAVIFKNEIQDFPSYWSQQWRGEYNAVSWNAHTIIDSNPECYLFDAMKPPQKRGSYCFGLFQRKTPLPTTWKWLQQRPSSWKPTVWINSDTIKVSFYTYTNHMKVAIYSHTITFNRQSYSPTSWNITQVLDGGKGWFCL